MHRVQCQQAIARVEHGLGNHDTKYVSVLLAVELSQLMQNTRHETVVCAHAHHPYGQNSVLGYFAAGIVYHAQDLVNDAKVRIGDVEHAQGDGQGALHVQFAQVKQVFE